MGTTLYVFLKHTYQTLHLQNATCNSTYFPLYLYFCDFSSNPIFCTILHLGEEFFARSSYEENFYTMKKYEVWAFQRRVERISATLQS